MKRIARLGADSFVAVDAVPSHEMLVKLLRAHLPPATAALFARPKPVEGGLVEWYSDLGGQPLPFDQLPAGEAAQVKRLLDERVASIQQLAERLAAQGGDSAQQAALLRQALRFPGTGALYALNGQPVITFWGHDLRGALPAEIHANPAVAAAGKPGAEVASAIPAAVASSDAERGAIPPMVASAPRKRSGCLWLMLALLLIMLTVVLWWLYCREPESPALPQAAPVAEEPKKESPVVEEIPPAQPVEAELPPEPAPIEEAPPEPAPAPEPVPPPPDPLDTLAKKVNATDDCAELEALLKEEPLLQAEDARAQFLRQQIRTTLDGRCKQEKAVQQQAKQAQIQQAKSQCPGQRPKELAPELMIVFDASGSMKERLPLTVQEQIQRKAVKDVTSGLGGLIGGDIGRTIGRSAEKATVGDPPTRMSAAKEAAVSVVRRTPNDTNIGLVMIENCPAGRSAGYYSPGQRGSLVNLLQSLQPRGGTPLGDSIAKAGQMVDGINRASVMVVISDGQESCGTDPCAVARQLAQTKPHLKINVVDIMGTGAGNCVAHATGGRVFTAKSVKELNLMVTQAAQDVLGPGNCP